MYEFNKILFKPYGLTMYLYTRFPLLESRTKWSLLGRLDFQPSDRNLLATRTVGSGSKSLWVIGYLPNQPLPSDKIPIASECNILAPIRVF